MSEIDCFETPDQEACMSDPDLPEVEPEQKLEFIRGADNKGFILYTVSQAVYWAI